MSLILGINASPRKGGNTEVLLEQILKGAASLNFETQTFHLARLNINPCLGCERCRRTQTCTRLLDDMQNIYPLLKKAQGLVLGSPTHNYNITAWMKAFIDRLYCFYEFTDDRPRKYTSQLKDQGKQALVYSICEQSSPKEMGVTLEAMALPLIPLGYKVTKMPPVTGYFDRGLVGKDNNLMQKAFKAGYDLAQNLE